jgi:diguanylate cyclase (GGDEF)-like protein/PAS domain S-box-containing protein
VRRDKQLSELVTDHFHQSAVPQAFLTPDGVIERANASFCDLFGYGRDRLVGMTADHLLDRFDPQRAGQHELVELGRDARSGVRQLDVVAQDAHGRRIPLLIDLTLVTDGAGRHRGYGCIVKDLTELREAQRRASGQQAFFEALNRRASDLAVVFDAEGQIIYASPSITELLGYQPSEVTSSSAFSFVHADDQEEARALVGAAIREPDRPGRAVLRIRDATGRWRFCEETVTNCLGDPEIGGLVANLRDITDSVEAQRALEESERRYRAIAETAHEGLIVVAQDDGATLFANSRFAEIIGVPLQDVYEYGVVSVLAPDQAAMIHANAIKRATVGNERYDLTYVRPDGEERIFQISASPLREGSGPASLAMVADVTAERRAAEQLKRAALHDALTGLPNRALLADRIEMALARQQRRPGSLVALMFLDVDRLKGINDSAGHAVGDAVLVEVARRLQAVVRDSDTVARLGGDEFVVLCEATSEAHAGRIAARLRSTLLQPVVIDSRTFQVTASIGVATSPPQDPDELLRGADAAMYQAKQRSGGGVLMYDQRLADSTRRHNELVSDVRAALDDGGLDVHYQPIVGLEGGRVLGVEALVRWPHERYGPIPALELLAAAKAAGLEAQLDHYVLHRACHDLGTLIERGLLPEDAYVSVNLDASTVSTPTIGATVCTAVRSARIRPANVVLEITESSVMTDVTAAIDQLRTLSRDGTRIAIDDFGTGYSSLAYLQQLPIHILKIDRSFVSQLTSDPASALIIRAILGLAGGLGLETVAEGIESEAQWRLLESLGCSAGQGFFWTGALPLDELCGHLLRRDA